MSSDISVHSSSYQVDDRQWLVGTHGVDLTPGITLDISKFTKRTRTTPTGTSRRARCSARSPLPACTGRTATPPVRWHADRCGAAVQLRARHRLQRAPRLTKVGGAMFVHGAVKESKLPTNSGVDTNGKADLSKIVWL
jgi:hypothetical protein